MHFNTLWLLRQFYNNYIVIDKKVAASMSRNLLRRFWINRKKSEEMVKLTKRFFLITSLFSRKQHTFMFYNILENQRDSVSQKYLQPFFIARNSKYGIVKF